MPDRQRTCPDCQGELHEIKLIDRGGRSPAAPYHHESLQYAVPEAKRSFWTGAFPTEGELIAFMCQGCGRVLLYGAQYEDA